MLHIYNSLTKTKELLQPNIDKNINIYVCGITVYDYCHIGHARTWIVFDILIRYLRHQGFKVNFVRNITDIDDKIINKAKENHQNWQDLTNFYIDAMHKDAAALGLISPFKEPKATDFMPQMISLVEKLLNKGFAYIGDNGDVFYAVRHYKDYGILSKRNLADLHQGARVEVNLAKRDPLDFVLWKLAKPGEPAWPSPWGDGRPGWHLECSAMSMYLLGDNFDIHGGGMDLMFPHHENECAQSSAVTNKPLANYWMHVGFLQVKKEKMSKSLGNFYLIKDILQHTHYEVLRYFMISSHYRSPLDYTEEGLVFSQQAMQRLYIAIRGLPLQDPIINSSFEQRFCLAMNDDINTAEALAILFDLAKEINKLREQNNIQQAAAYAALLKKLGNILGLLNSNSAEDFLQHGTNNKIDLKIKIEKLITAREQARKNKDWQQADQLRTQLMELRVVLEDTPNGTIWRIE